MSEVKIVEVGPRDGLQNEPNYLETEHKLELVKLLAESGLKNIEITSFVRPSAIPQMKDSAQLFPEVVKHFADKFNNYNFPVLVPNLKGMENAIQAGVKEIAIFTATSESFTRKNINSTIDESFERFKPVAELAQKNNIKIRGYVSTAFYCPYEGKMPIDKLVDITKRLFDLGVYEVSIGDTVGMATPNEVEDVINELKKSFALDKIAMHFHDTRGMAIANILKSLDLGIRTFDSSVAGLGGCPYAKGASGNVATEEVVFLMNRLGYRTNIDLEALYKAGLFVVDKLNRNKMSKLLESYAKSLK